MNDTACLPRRGPDSAAAVIGEREADLEPFLLQAQDECGHNASKTSEKRLRLNSTSAVISLMQSGRHAGFASFWRCTAHAGCRSAHCVEWCRDIDPVLNLLASAP